MTLFQGGSGTQAVKGNEQPKGDILYFPKTLALLQLKQVMLP